MEHEKLAKSLDLESPHFLTFSAKRGEFKIGGRDGHGKSGNGYGKVMDKYFVKSVGTLTVKPFILGRGLNKG